MRSETTVVGRVAGLWRYPVKSMAGEQLHAADVSWHGFAGDRRWAFIRPGLESSNFPWLTIRELPEMGHYRPRFAEPERPDDSRTLVRTADGDELEVIDPRLAARLGTGIRLIKQNRGVFDIAPLALITTSTIAAMSGEVGLELEVARFRPNILIEPVGGQRFPEDTWVGSTLQMGGAAVRVDQRDKRCVMVNIDPRTSQRDPRVLRSIAKHRDAHLGVYGSTVRPGRVTVGDPLVILSSG